MLETGNIPLTLIRRSLQNKYLSKDLLLLLNEIGIEKPQIKNPWNTLCKDMIRKRWLSCRVVLFWCERYNNFFFKRATRKVRGYYFEEAVDWTWNVKQLSLRVHFWLIDGTVESANFIKLKILLNCAKSFPRKILWRSRRTTLLTAKARFSINYFV